MLDTFELPVSYVTAQSSSAMMRDHMSLSQHGLHVIRFVHICDQLDLQATNQ